MSIPYLRQVRSRPRTEVLRHYLDLESEARAVKLALESLDRLSPQERAQSLRDALLDIARPL